MRTSFAETSGARPWVIHLAEGTDDVAHGELAALDALGCLQGNTVLVHGVGLSCTDIESVIARGASVVWCPASNIGMLGQTLDAAPFAAADRLALGTDSRLTGSRDLLDELRCAALTRRVEPSALLHLVTTAASNVFGLGDAGRLDVGSPADCVILRGDDPHDALLGARRADLRAVIRGGAPVVADPDLAEWFDHCGIPAVHARLDGRPKLVARHIARADAVALEPGLEIL